MKVKRMGITETLRRIWLFNANKIKPVHSSFVLAKSTDEVLRTLIEKRVWVFLHVS